jgi:hypothetical protein
MLKQQNKLHGFQSARETIPNEPPPLLVGEITVNFRS